MPILSSKLNFIAKVLFKPLAVISQTGFKWINLVGGFSQGMFLNKRDTTSNGTATAKYLAVGNSHTLAPAGNWNSGALVMAKFNEDRILTVNGQTAAYWTISERDTATNTWTNTLATVVGGTYYPISYNSTWRRVVWHPSGNYVVIINFANNGNAQIFSYNNSTKTFTLVSNNTIGNIPRANCIAWNSDGTKLAVGTSLSSPYVFVYSFDTTTNLFTALPALSVAAPSAPTDIEWTGTNILAVGCNNATTPFRTYDCSSGTPTAITAPTMPTIATTFVSWNPAGTILVVGGANATVSYYNYSGGTLTKGANAISSSTASGPQNYPSWSSDGTKFSTMGGIGGFNLGFSLWTVSGETFTNTGTSNPSRGNGIQPAYTYGYTYAAFYNNNGTKYYVLAVNVGIIEYSLSGSTWTMTNTFTEPMLRNNTQYAQMSTVGFSPNGTYMIMAGRTTPYMYVYTISGDTLTLGSISGTTPTVYYYQIRWTPDSSAFIIGTGNGGQRIYTVSGSVATFRQNLGLTSAGYEIAWADNTYFVLLGHDATNNIKVYSWNGTTTATNVVSINQATPPVSGDWLDSGTLLTGNVSTGIIPYAFTGGNTLTAGTLTGHPCYALKFSPNKQYVATAFGSVMRVYKASGTGSSVTLTQIYTTTLPWTTNSVTIKWSNDNTTLIYIPTIPSTLNPIQQFGRSGDTIIKQNNPQWNANQLGYQYQSGTTYSTNVSNVLDVYDDGSTTTVIG